MAGAALCQPMLGDTTWSVLVGSVLVLLLVSQVALWAVVFQVVKQHGRLLLRLDELRPAHAAHAPPPGPTVGDTVAPFHLPDLTGQQVALESYRGRRVLLVNWSPECGFCDLIAPELAEQFLPLRKQGVDLLLVSSGDPVKNLQAAQRHHLDSPIVLQPQQPIDVFRGQGTPVACLVDAEGKVAVPLAIGAEAVPALVHDLARKATRPPEEPALDSKTSRLLAGKPLSESRIVRDGLKAGTPAPNFVLPDVHGHRVELEDFRGSRVVLVFTDPHCGPCETLAPRLAHEKDVRLVMISRGDLEESRRKAQQYGFDFPVLVQEHWEVSRAFGIFATPVAFSIGPDGVIERNVAQGADSIVSLINELRKEERDGLVIR